MIRRAPFKTYISRPSLILILTSSLALGSQELVWGLENTIRSNNQGAKAHTEVIRGINLLYNENFNEAEDLFLKVVNESTGRPVGYFYLAMVTWSRLAFGFWSPATVREYKERIDRTIQVAETRIENNVADSYDYFYLGGALGFKGRFELMKRKWVSSFFLARDAGCRRVVD